MKNKGLIPVSFINLFVILIVMGILGLHTQSTISELTIRDIKNVTLLTQTNIHAEIIQDLVEPINASLIMSHNTLLLDLMDRDTSKTEEVITEYLTSIQKSTDYESVFLVPHSTLNYYHPGGTDAKLVLSDNSSEWYKVLMNSEKNYILDINTEQLDKWSMTVYIDAAIHGSNGEFKGVTGVGKRITRFQEILKRYKEDFQVEAYVIDGNGLIQIHSDSNRIKTIDIYSLENIKRSQFDFAINTESYYETTIDDKYFISQYIPALDWYLIVKKSTSDFSSILWQYNKRMHLILLMAGIVMVLVTSLAIRRYRDQIIRLSNIDQLTNIYNRTIFENELASAIKNKERRQFCLVLLDVDNLKNINDKLGHDKGDFTLKTVAEIFKMNITKPSIISRIGGDEFGIIYFDDIKNVCKALDIKRDRVKKTMSKYEMKVSVSIGVTKSITSDTESTIYKRADDALYMSKTSGRNKLSRL